MLYNREHEIWIKGKHLTSYIINENKFKKIHHNRYYDIN